MPVAVPIIGVAVSAGMSALQMSKANKEKRAAQRAIDGYQRQDLTNPYGALSVSTLGADYQREATARAMASFGNQVSMGGSRSIAASLPNLLEQQNNQEAQIAANLDQQQMQINQMKAGGDMQVMGMQEQRENNDLLGLGNQLSIAQQQRDAAANQLMQSAVSGVVDVATAGAKAGWFGSKGTLGSHTPNPNLNSNLNNRLVSPNLNLPPIAIQSSGLPGSSYNPGYAFNNGYVWDNNLLSK